MLQCVDELLKTDLILILERDRGELVAMRRELLGLIKDIDDLLLK